MKSLLTVLIPSLLVACASPEGDMAAENLPVEPMSPTHGSSMDLGAFSVSLAVKDLAASREFYGKLGFTPTGGDPAQNWQILRNGDHVIGLFQGLFEGNILTFNPGWDQATSSIADFTDVRDLQSALKASGVTLTMEADATTTGPASFVLVDPDGNSILIDQHVPSPPSFSPAR